MHPYRQPCPRSSRPEDAAGGIDLEECFVHALIFVAGAIGVVAGAVNSRPTELSLGGLLALFALRVLWKEISSRSCAWRTRRERDELVRRHGSP
jgi:hypothetical protein